jgi:hypothetical protein
LGKGGYPDRYIIEIDAADNARILKVHTQEDAAGARHQRQRERAAPSNANRYFRLDLGFAPFAPVSRVNRIELRQ